ncbi:non-functional protein STAY-GREEN, chloroplastic-like [Populus nigra]|uniref:non-functional protein STAY-GREEN, chloroplastic-like n=1 Tax=Populus nigra TaxID=3691 RepID=UPI002B269850|nr:non-functional protein STAY-GREEN, chloroplastic-like [Populus nigra]
MAKLNGGPLHPSKQGPSVFEQNSSFFFYGRKPMTIKKKNLFTGPVARLLGPAIFEASKPKVLLLEVENKQPAAGTCTLTNCNPLPSIICKTKTFPSTIFSWACQYAIILLAFILLLSFIPFR